jgi:hypothetical protein
MSEKIRCLCDNRSGGSELRTTSRVTSENQGSIIKIVKDRINYYEFESVTEALLQSRIRQKNSQKGTTMLYRPKTSLNLFFKC